MWGTWDNLLRLVLPSHRVDFRDQTQILRRGGELSPYPPSRLSRPASVDLIALSDLQASPSSLRHQSQADASPAGLTVQPARIRNRNLGSFLSTFYRRQTAWRTESSGNGKDSAVRKERSRVCLWLPDLWLCCFQWGSTCSISASSFTCTETSPSTLRRFPSPSCR